MGHIDEVAMYIIYKQSKIQFTVKNKTNFEELNKLLYSHLLKHLVTELNHSIEKA